MRNKLVGMLVIVVLEVGCTGVSRGSIALPKYNDERWTYTGVSFGNNAEPYGMIPQALLEDSTMFSEARSCAIAYNDALDAMRNCDGFNATFRAFEVGTAGLAVIATGVASQVKSDDAKRHWVMTSLVSSALFTGLTTFDLWHNCRDRTFNQQALAAERLARLQNAGHLVECANRIGTFQVQLAAAQRALEVVPSATGSDKALLIGEINPLAVQSLAMRLDATQTVAALSEDEKKANTRAATELEELAKLIPALCNEPAPVPPAPVPPAPVPPAPPQVSRLSPITYYDRAHAELIGCFKPRPTPYGEDRSDSGSNSR